MIPAMVETFEQYVTRFRTEICSLREIEISDIKASHSKRYQELAQQITTMAARRDFLVTFDLATVEQILGFRDGLMKVFLKTTQIDPRRIPTSEFQRATWSQLDIIRFPEIEAVIKKFGLKSGVPLGYKSVAAQMGFKAMSSAGRIVPEGLFKLSQPVNVTVLQNAIWHP